MAPYHLRLDWLLWFVPMSSSFAEGWFLGFLLKLLDNDRETLKLLSRNPVAGAPPGFVRVRLYRYRFTTRQERRTTGAWWARELVGEYLPPLTLRPASGLRPDVGSSRH